MGKGRTREDRRQTGAERAIRPGQPLPPGRRVPAPAPPDRHRYAITELEELTGVSKRNIRYYITLGLLPPSHGRGPTAYYDRGHLLRLQAIKQRQDEHEPLDAIKDALANLTDDEIAADLAVQTAPPEDRWRRVLLHPDVELHVREAAGERDRRLDSIVERVVEYAEYEFARLGLNE
jgi:DNA-binding transcriptional MerR regulator